MKSMLPKLTEEDYYIVMTDEQGDIHVAPDHASPIVAHAYLGDVFNVSDLQNQWYEIQLLSSAHRYIYRSHARKKRTYKLTLPANVEVRHTIFNAIVEAEARAREQIAEAGGRNARRQRRSGVRVEDDVIVTLRHAALRLGGQRADGSSRSPT